MENFRGKRVFLLLVLITCLATGCGERQTAENVKIVENVELGNSVETVEESDIAENTEPAESMEPAESTEAVPNRAAAGSAEDVSGTEVLPEYIETMQEFLLNQEYESDFFSPDQVRFQLAFVDQDGIPELLLCEGNGHADGIFIYKYDPENGKMRKVDVFSSFGRFSYVPSENIVKSFYGNHGYYTSIFTRIQEDLAVDIIDAVVSDGSGVRSEDILYYHGMDGDTYHGIYYDTSKELVTETEYNDIIDSLTGGQETEIEYNDMIGITEESIKEIWP